MPEQTPQEKEAQRIEQERLRKKFANENQDQKKRLDALFERALMDLQANPDNYSTLAKLNLQLLSKSIPVMDHLGQKSAGPREQIMIQMGEDALGLALIDCLKMVGTAIPSIALFIKEWVATGSASEAVSEAWGLYTAANTSNMSYFQNNDPLPEKKEWEAPAPRTFLPSGGAGQPAQNQGDENPQDPEPRAGRRGGPNPNQNGN